MSGVTLSKSGIAGDYSSQIDALFSEYDKPHSPGVNLAVVSQGIVIHQRGYGVANLEDDVPFTAETILRLGSTTKHMCATCILILENKGLLNLEDDIRQHLPELPEFGARISVNHLLTMTSGFRDGLNMLLFSGLGVENNISRSQITELLTRDTSLMFQPGDNCTYSNTNYVLLSSIIERLSGATIADFMQTEIFEPLGMLNSKLAPEMASSTPHAARGYVPHEDGDYEDGLMLVELSGDGGVVSTLNDMVRWFHNYRNDELFGPDFRHRLEAENRLNDGQLIEYRCGINVTRQSGELKVSHAGGMPGYLCDFAYFPDRDLGIILFTNVFDPGLLETPDKIAGIIPGQTEHAGVSSSIPEAGMELPLGCFASETDALILETAREQDAWVCYFLGERHCLKNSGHNTFIGLKTGSPLKIILSTSEGNVLEGNGFKLVLGNTPVINLTKPVDSPDRHLTQLADYEGQYWSDVLQETHLVTVHNTGVEIELTSPLRNLVWKEFNHVTGDLFTSVIAGEPSSTNVQILFTRDESNQVNGLRYNLSRCLDVRFEKRSLVKR